MQKDYPRKIIPIQQNTIINQCIDPLVYKKLAHGLPFEPDRCVEVDTATSKAFEDEMNCNFKLDYLHTEGYSSANRFWYKVKIRDSLITYSFESPFNDLWNAISFEKTEILSESELNRIKGGVLKTNLEQKTPGFPIPKGSGYGADKLWLESETLSLFGGTTFMCVGPLMTAEQSQNLLLLEKTTSSTLSGDYQDFFDQIEAQFKELNMLLKNKDKQ